MQDAPGAGFPTSGRTVRGCSGLVRTANAEIAAVAIREGIILFGTPLWWTLSVVECRLWSS